MSEWQITESADDVTFRVRVVPRSSRSQIAGVEGGALKIKLTAPPIEGAANRALVEFIADWLGVRRSSVAIVSGDRARIKIVRAKGVTRDWVLERLAAPGRA